MNTVKCKEPGCPCELNTTFYCENSISLFGIRAVLEKEIENHEGNNDKQIELYRYLNYVNLQIKSFKMEDEEAAYTTFKTASFLKSPKPLKSFKTLYLICDNKHGFSYDIECN